MGFEPTFQTSWLPMDAVPISVDTQQRAVRYTISSAASVTSCGISVIPRCGTSHKIQARQFRIRAQGRDR